MLLTRCVQYCKQATSCRVVGVKPPTSKMYGDRAGSTGKLLSVWLFAVSHMAAKDLYVRTYVCSEEGTKIWSVCHPTTEKYRRLHFGTTLFVYYGVPVLVPVGSTHHVVSYGHRAGM